jgi:hypothetical protein
MLFLLAFGQMPFVKATKDDQYYGHIYKNDMASYLLEHPSTRELYLQNKLDKDMILTIFSCLQANPKNRPSISQLLLHPFVMDTPD